jgi:hypothetical protein
MEKQEGIEILTEILETANEFGDLWDGRPNYINKSCSEDVPFKHKLHLFSFLREDWNNPLYVSIGKEEDFDNKGLCYSINGKYIKMSPSERIKSPNQIYDFLENLLYIEGDKIDYVGEQIEKMKEVFQKRIMKAKKLKMDYSSF